MGKHQAAEDQMLANRGTRRSTDAVSFRPFTGGLAGAPFWG
jgi:hypothetical protein